MSRVRLRMLVAATSAIGILGCAHTRTPQPAQTPAPAATTKGSPAAEMNLPAMPVVIGAKNGPPECASEEAWIARYLPGAHEAGQMLLRDGGRMLDAVNFMLPDGTGLSVVFDVTATF